MLGSEILPIEIGDMILSILVFCFRPVIYFYILFNVWHMVCMFRILRSLAPLFGLVKHADVCSVLYTDNAFCANVCVFNYFSFLLEYKW